MLKVQKRILDCKVQRHLEFHSTVIRCIVGRPAQWDEMSRKTSNLSRFYTARTFLPASYLHNYKSLEMDQSHNKRSLMS